MEGGPPSPPGRVPGRRARSARSNSRGSARSNDTSSSHHSEKDLSTPSDTASVAQENAARLTTHKLAAENDTHSCSPSRVQQSELDAAKSAQDAATAANAAALEAKAALAQAQAEAQEIIRQSKFQADQMIKQAQEAALRFRAGETRGPFDGQFPFFLWLFSGPLLG